MLFCLHTQYPPESWCPSENVFAAVVFVTVMSVGFSLVNSSITTNYAGLIPKIKKNIYLLKALCVVNTQK